MRIVFVLLTVVCMPFWGVRAADYFWVGGSGNWNDVNHWATTSGGNTFHTVAPGSNDNVFFDANSFTALGQSVTVNLATPNCNNMSWAGVTNAPSFVSGTPGNLSIFGDLLLVPSVNFAYAGGVIFTGNGGINSVTLAGNTVNSATFDGIGSLWNLQDNFSAPLGVTLLNGTLQLNGNDMTAGAFTSANPNNRSLNITGSHLTLGSWQFNGTNATLNAANSLIECSTNFEHTGTGQTYHNLQFNGSSTLYTAGSSTYNVVNGTPSFNILTDGSAVIDTLLSGGLLILNGSHQIQYMSSAAEMRITGTHQVTKAQCGAMLRTNGNNTLLVMDVAANGRIKGSNTFDSLRFNTAGSWIMFEEGVSQVIQEHLLVNSSCTQPSLMESMDRGQAAGLAMGGATFEMQHVSLQDLSVTGSPAQVTSNLINVANVTGITANATPLTLYWVGGSGAWSDVNHWSLTSGGAGGNCIPREIDDVIFDGGSFTGAATVNVDVQLARCANMDWLNAPGSPVFINGPDAKQVRIYESLFLSATAAMSYDHRYVFEATTAGQVIESNGNSLNGSFVFRGIGGEWGYVDDARTTDSVIFERGVLSLNNNDLEAEAFFSTLINNRTLNMANSTISLVTPVPSGEVKWNVLGANLTLNAANSLIEINGGDFRHVLPGKVYHNVDLDHPLGPRAMEGGESDFNRIQCWIPSSQNNLFDNNTIDSLVLHSGEMRIHDQQTINVGYMNGVSRIIDDPTIDHYEVFELADFDPGAQASINYCRFYDDGNILGTNQFDTLILEGGHVYKWGSNQTQIIWDQFVAIGNCANLIFLEANTSGTPATIQTSVAINTDYTSIRDLTVTGVTPANAINSVDLGNNTNWNIVTATPLTLYWVGGTGNWNDVNHWSFTSGGPPGACVPTAIDTAIFDQNSFTAINDTVWLNVSNAACATMDWSALNQAAVLNATNNGNILRIFASLYLNNQINNLFQGDIYFEATSTGFDIDPDGVTLNGVAFFVGQGGGWTLQNELFVNDELYFEHGDLNSNEQGIRCTNFFSNYSSARTLDISNDTVLVQGSQWRMSGTNLTLDATNSFIRVVGFAGFEHSGTPKVYHNVQTNGTSFSGGNSLFNVVTSTAGQVEDNNRIDTLILQTGSGVMTGADTVNYLEVFPSISVQGSHQVQVADFYDNALINGSNYFRHATMHDNGTFTNSNLFDTLRIEPGRTYRLGANQIQEFGVILSNWNPCFPSIWQSNVSGIQAQMRLLTDTLHSDFMEIRDINHLGNFPFYAGNFGIDQGNNTDVLFISEPDFAFGFQRDTLFFQCGTTVQPVTLTANFFNPDSVVWSNGQTGPSITFTPPDTIGFRVHYGTCVFVDTLRAGLQTFVPIVHQSQADTTLCSGDTLTLTAAASGTGFTYLWNNSPPATTQSIQVSPTTTTQYAVTVTRAGQSCSDSILINVSTAPALSINDDTITCPGDTLFVDAGAGFDFYGWSNGDSTQNSFYNAPGTHFVVAGNMQGCTRIDSFRVHVLNPIDFDLFAFDASCNGFSDGSAYIDTVNLDPAYTFTWQNGTPNRGLLSGLSSGFYMITVSSGPDCFRIDSVLIEEPVLPVVRDTVQQPTCFGDADGIIYVTSDPPSHPLQYQWFDNSTADSLPGVSAGDYVLEIQDTNNCLYFDTITVTQPTPVQALLPPDTSLCLGDSLTLTGSATGGNGNPYNFEWFGVTGAGPHTFMPSQDTTLRLQATDALGCVSAVDSLQLTIREVIFLTAPPEQGLCSGREATVALTLMTAGDTSNLTIQWSDGLGTGLVKTFTPTQNEYTVSVLEGCDANAVDTVRFRFEPEPEPAYTSEVLFECDSVNLLLTDASRFADSIVWQLPQGPIPNASEVSVHFAYAAQNPTITLQAFNALCDVQTSFDVTFGSLEDELKTAIPNVITPNGDGINDLFRLGEGFRLTECFSVSVFNRWGLLVYEGPGPWDGRTFSGEELPVGTYYYVAELGVLSYQGSLQILR